MRGEGTAGRQGLQQPSLRGSCCHPTTTGSLSRVLISHACCRGFQQPQRGNELCVAVLAHRSPLRAMSWGATHHTSPEQEARFAAPWG